MANTISQQEHERHKRRHARQWLGLAICVLVLIGGFTVIATAVNGVAVLFDNTDEKLEYEDRLQALVMLDPLPFESLDQADPALFKEASIWAAVSAAQNSATGWTPTSATPTPTACCCRRGGGRRGGRPLRAGL